MTPASRRLALSLAAITVLVAGGCGHRRAPAHPHEVVFWHSLPAAIVDSVLRSFEAANPGVRVTAVAMPESTSADSAAAAVAAGNPPDLCQLHGEDLPPFLARNSLSDWSAGVADLRPDAAAPSPDSGMGIGSLRGWPMCMLGDAIYGVPWLLSPRLLYKNRGLFAHAHMDSGAVVATWSDLQSAAARIDRLRGGIHGFGLSTGRPGHSLEAFMTWAWSNDGGFLSARLDSSLINCRANIEALEYLASLRNVSRIAADDTLEHEFLAGRLGMIVADSRRMTRWQRIAPQISYGWTNVPSATPNRLTLTVGSGEVLVSFTGSRHKEDALRLARFLVRPSVERAVARATGNVEPAWKAGRTTGIGGPSPVDRATFLPNIRNRAALEDTLQALLDDAILGRRTAANALATADSFMTTHLGVK